MSIERLESIARTLQAINSPDASWLVEALSDLRVGVPVSEALGFSPANQRAKRDAAIRRAAEMIEGSDWQKAQKLERWIAWLEFDVTPPAGCCEGAMENALDAAQSSGLALPRSARQIYRIIVTDIER